MKFIIMHDYYILINTFFFLKKKSMPLLSYLGFLETGSYTSQAGLELARVEDEFDSTS